MSTNYSLICWGGREGKTCTISNASPAVVTLNNHGIRDNLAGKGVYFTTDGALPAPLVADTVYYALRTADNTFNLYDTEANAITGGATGLIATTTAGSGTHTARGAYYKSLTTEQKARYGASGSERIYDGLVLYGSERTGAGLGSFDNEVVEIGEAYTDYYANTAAVPLELNTYSLTIETKINGIRTPAFHYGDIAQAGYVLRASTSYTNLQPKASNFKIDGITFLQPLSSYGGIVTQTVNANVVNNIFLGNSTGSEGTALTIGKTGGLVANNLFVGKWQHAITVAAYQNNSGLIVSNNTVIGANYGFKHHSAENPSYEVVLCNNVSLDCVTDDWQDDGWETRISFLAAFQNAGDDADKIWFKSPGGVVETTLSTAITDAANGDYTPKIDGSLVGASVLPFGVPTTDILGKPRIQKISVTHEFAYDNLIGTFPSWAILTWGTGGTAGTGRLVEVTEVGTAGTMGVHLISGVAPTDGLEITDGTATCDVDGTVTTGERWVNSPGCSIGAFEYDYGAPPPSTTITLSANVSLLGAEIRVYESAPGDYIGDELVGVESNSTNGYSFELPSGTNIVIQVMKSGYVEYIQAITVPESDFTLPISLVVDINA